MNCISGIARQILFHLQNAFFVLEGDFAYSLALYMKVVNRINCGELAIWKYSNFNWILLSYYTYNSSPSVINIQIIKNQRQITRYLCNICILKVNQIFKLNSEENTTNRRHGTNCLTLTFSASCENKCKFSLITELTLYVQQYGISVICSLFYCLRCTIIIIRCDECGDTIRLSLTWVNLLFNKIRWKFSDTFVTPAWIIFI